MAASTNTTSTIDSKGSEFVSVFFGFLIILGAIYGLFLGGQAIYHRLSPPPTLALMAGLEPNSSNQRYSLHVEGAVQRSGQPLNGQAQLTVRVLWAGSPQSVSVPIENGRFTLRQNPQLTFDRKDAKLLVSAEAWTRELPKRSAQAEIYLNASFPIRYKRLFNGLLMAIVVIIAVVFFLTFTGQRSPLKNRVAIVFSYCVMVLFLAIPLTVTNIALSMFTDQFERMNQTPVGIVLAKPTDAKAETQAQWLLNIGGRIVKEKPGTAPPAQSYDAKSGAVTATPAATAIPATTTQPAGEAATTPAPSPAPNDLTAAEGSEAPPGTAPPEDLRIEGGIAIPFYVLVLAVIGGAINMARKIPAYHQEGERSAIEVQPFSLMRSMMSSSETSKKLQDQQESNAGGPPPGVNAPPADDKLASDIVPSSAQPQSGIKPSTTTGPKEDWRTGLLNQYMYLISSPFLAIVTYYLLAWLGVSTVPALVLVSFSVGLISEPVMARITGAAETIIGGKEAQPQREEEPKPEGAKDAPEAGEEEKKAAGAAKS